MRLTPDCLGRITAEYPATFYRVSTWATERRVADFSTHGEAAAFAITDARESGCRYDHKVSTMHVRKG